ncbi:amidohydrolase [Pelagibius sp.]|uniref:amidohydrolase n=1 Tax=Pelagibius sp. TaxID=1931238 RepID=UPI0026144F7B|nr:amidohydrolase [Pelagibius sp.]
MKSTELDSDMAVDREILEFEDEMRKWRHALHRHPETAFQEVETSRFVAARLDEMGIPYTAGLAHTGIVAQLGNGQGPKIALRADMDALDIQEATDLRYASEVEGKMHACGHDGHTTMLLGAAGVLSRKRDLPGTVYLIFQPAEEFEAGARKMIEEGLFERFPVSAVFGLHNWPGLAVGRAAVSSGPVMAGSGTFEITVAGKGTHAGMPQTGTDQILAAARLIENAQGIVSREINPGEAAAVSFTKIHGGTAFNVIPETVHLAGTIRALSDPTLADIRERLEHHAGIVGRQFGVEVTLSYTPGYPATFNDPRYAALARSAAGAVLEDRHIDEQSPASMGSEDFAFMLAQRPGAYIWLGAGTDRAGLHSPHYDFNDDLLPIGVAYWVKLAELALRQEP